MFGRMNLTDCQTLFILGGSAFVASALSAPQVTLRPAAKEEVSRGEEVGTVEASRMNDAATTAEAAQLEAV